MVGIILVGARVVSIRNNALVAVNVVLTIGADNDLASSSLVIGNVVSVRNVADIGIQLSVSKETVTVIGSDVDRGIGASKEAIVVAVCVITTICVVVVLRCVGRRVRVDKGHLLLTLLKLGLSLTSTLLNFLAE
ncbi:hypothetical protein B0T14DRAFT_527184 [Immersiella caudata]|uniref:Uncharacterized protein n=1 Tax=Immersiella caudata TaxID=314043 RepID=A0AA40BU78_9PEZI|nr:hypothetical protein B0T14DRAFT_527184 [Immersiella caudata]